jgi:hypothetical protein
MQPDSKRITVLDVGRAKADLRRPFIKDQVESLPLSGVIADFQAATRAKDQPSIYCFLLYGEMRRARGEHEREPSNAQDAANAAW